jgi:hypothetical protein
MTLDFKTLTFPNTPAGQEEKIHALKAHAARGWRIESEAISSGSYDVDTAVKEGLCLCIACAPICAPFALLGKQKAGIISVTLSRTDDARAEYEQEALRNAIEKAENEALIRKEMREKRVDRLEWLRSLPVERFPAIDGNHRGTNLYKALYEYIMRDSPLKPLPDLGKCTRDGRGITLRDSSGRDLATYSFKDLAALPPVDE